MSIYKKTRLDRLLVQRGLAATRSKAADAIRRGLVSVGGAVAAKPGMLVDPGAAVGLSAGPDAHVSRGAHKLAAALDAFGFDPAGRIAVDLGASTGGFTQVLLQRGAACVYAVDVGHGQLHESLRSDSRVANLEGVDARDLGAASVPGPVAAIVADVSFIALTKALPAALALAAPGAWLVALIKPQFEAGRAAVGKGGIVRDAAAREAAVEKVRAWLAARPGWRVAGVVPSPLAGADGNLEFLIGARHDG